MRALINQGVKETPINVNNNEVYALPHLGGTRQVPSLEQPNYNYMNANCLLKQSITDYIKSIVMQQEKHELRLKSYTIGLVDFEVEDGDMVFTADFSNQGDGCTYYASRGKECIDIDEMSIDDLLGLCRDVYHAKG